MPHCCAAFALSAFAGLVVLIYDFARQMRNPARFLGSLSACRETPFIEISPFFDTQTAGVIPAVFYPNHLMRRVGAAISRPLGVSNRRNYGF